MTCFHTQRFLVVLALGLGVSLPSASGADALPGATAASLEKHCADCRDRATISPATAKEGIGHGGQKLLFRYAQPVDAAGELADGRKFADIRQFKRLLLDNEIQLARNLAQQLTVYATGAPVLFSDRGQIEKILERASANHYGVRMLIHELVQSELFLHK